MSNSIIMNIRNNLYPVLVRNAENAPTDDQGTVRVRKHWVYLLAVIIAFIITILCIGLAIYFMTLKNGSAFAIAIVAIPVIFLLPEAIFGFLDYKNKYVETGRDYIEQRYWTGRTVRIPFHEIKSYSFKPGYLKYEIGSNDTAQLAQEIDRITETTNNLMNLNFSSPGHRQREIDRMNPWESPGGHLVLRADGKRKIKFEPRFYRGERVAGALAFRRQQDHWPDPNNGDEQDTLAHLANSGEAYRYLINNDWGRNLNT